MTTSLLIAAFFGLLLPGLGITELLVENCGISSTMAPIMTTKIFRGEVATINSNPWLAMLSKPGKEGKAPEFRCGGTLIHECFVLTAAHCVVNNTQIIIRLGEYDRSLEDDTFTEDIYVSQAHIYPTYKELDHVNDIALLRLSRCVSYKVHIRPICILLDPRKKSQTDAIRKFTAVGWGRTESRATSNVPMTATLQRLPMSRCDALFWSTRNDTQFCAGTSSGMDTCQGDSGGPLYAKGRYAGVERMTQLGIVSYGSTECSGVGIYTDVMSYVDWIERIVLASDIVVVVPEMDLLDSSCLGNVTLVGGAKPRTSAFPWLAYVLIDSFHLAFGTLISDSFVLSTAQSFPAGAPLQVLLGRDSGAAEVTHKVVSVHRHPEFESLTVNDIALLKLETKVQFTDHIRPICLPNLTSEIELNTFRKKADKAQNLMAIGFGQHTSASVQRLNSSNCYQGNYQPIGEKHICMQHPQTTSLASGSPLVRQLAVGNTMAHTLVGVASFGRSDLHAPDVYTNVLSYSEWIAGLMK